MEQREHRDECCEIVVLVFIFELYWTFFNIYCICYCLFYL